MQGNSHLACEIDQRDTKRDQRPDEQQRHAVFVGQVIECADERDYDDERSEYRRKNGTEQRVAQEGGPTPEAGYVGLEIRL